MLTAGSTSITLYGFDARRPLGRGAPEWSADRREQYLLRPDIAEPVSVDAAVWPKVPTGILTDGRASDYWADLAELRRNLDSKLQEGATLIALSVRVDCDAARSLFINCSPTEISPDWKSLGWDVADNGLMSGLSNAGYLPEMDDISTLRATFGNRLNPHGLFDDLSTAERFRALSDVRVPEHAPFLIHHLFLVESL